MEKNYNNLSLSLLERCVIKKLECQVWEGAAGMLWWVSLSDNYGLKVTGNYFIIPRLMVFKIMETKGEQTKRNSGLKLKQPNRDVAN